MLSQCSKYTKYNSFHPFFKKAEMSKLGSNDQLLNDAHLWMPLLRRQLKELTRTWRRFEVVEVVVILPKLRTTFWGLSLFALRAPDLFDALVSKQHSFVVCKIVSWWSYLFVTSGKEMQRLSETKWAFLEHEPRRHISELQWPYCSIQTGQQYTNTYMLNTFVAIHWERETQGTRSNNTKTRFTQLHICEQEPTLSNCQDHISGSMLRQGRKDH